MSSILQVGDQKISSDEARDPAVLANLEQHLRRTTAFAAAVVVPTALFAAGALWTRSSHSGLVLWVVLVSINAAQWLTAMREPDKQQWLPRARVIHFAGAISWGLLPVVAMPEAPTWQLFVAALLLGVQASNVLFSSQLRQMFYLFHIPLVVVSLPAFLLNGTEAGRWGAALLAYAAVFAIGLSEINHSTQLTAAVLAVRSAKLTAGLEEERQALSMANDALEELARTDPLTGLPNRLEFTDQLNEALAITSYDAKELVGVAYIDLDGFKRINDSLGHQVGDLLLIAVATRLSAQLDTDEVLARLGGDELVVLSPCLDRDVGCDRLGDRLKRAFLEPFVIESRRVEIGASIGLAVATEEVLADDLLRFADAALYRGKVERGTAVEIFDESMMHELRNRQSFEADLEQALHEGELVPWLQPIVDLSTGEVVAAEALARWLHPSGVRTAASFLDAAASRGILSQLSHKVLACIIDYRIDLLGQGIEPIRIATNVAPQHLEALLQSFGTDGSLQGLTIEITEESMFSSPATLNQLIDQAHELGATVSLDDFGTGLSTLCMALDLHVDGYKVDRRFVAQLGIDPSAEAVVAALVELATRQDRSLVAEGVETLEQAERLADLGVRLGQGYLFSPAISIQAFTELLGTQIRYPVAVQHDASQRELVDGAPRER